MEFLLEIVLRLLFLPLEMAVGWLSHRWPLATVGLAIGGVALLALGAIAWWTWPLGLG